MEPSILSTASRYFLSIQFLLGSQARLLPNLTPEISKIPYAHADGFRSSLSIIPGSTSTQHTRNMGWLLGVGGVLLLIPRSKTSDRHGLGSVLARVGDGLALVLPAMFVWAHVRLGLNPALPLLNVVLAGVMWWGRGRVEYTVQDDLE